MMIVLEYIKQIIIGRFNLLLMHQELYDAGVKSIK